MDRNLRAQHVVELKHAIGEVLTKFDISGLAAEDIDEALELVEEVEPEGSDETFWRPCLDRVLAAVELYDDGIGPLRTNVTGLSHLKLESWELAAARRAVTHGAPASAQDRTILARSSLRIKADLESEPLHAIGRRVPRPELVKAARGDARAPPQVDRALQELVDGIRRGQEVRWWTRTRFRLLRSTADLWLPPRRGRDRRRRRRGRKRDSPVRSPLFSLCALPAAASPPPPLPYTRAHERRAD